MPKNVFIKLIFYIQKAKREDPTFMITVIQFIMIEISNVIKAKLILEKTLNVIPNRNRHGFIGNIYSETKKKILAPRKDHFTIL
jgi:hypothetical protein